MRCPAPTHIDDITDALNLWRLLVSGAVDRPLPPTVAVNAFRRLHRGGEPGAWDSALLLCTDWRWHRVSAKVIAGVVDSAILDDEEQDRLADALLWHEQARYRHPFWWLGTTFVGYDLDSPSPGRVIHVDPNTPTTAHRQVWPPLRPGPPAASSCDIERRHATCWSMRGRCPHATLQPWRREPCASSTTSTRMRHTPY